MRAESFDAWRERVPPPGAWRERVPPPGARNVAWNEFLDLVPQLRALAATPQDAYYHAEGDVWTHTKMVCEAALDLPDYAAADPSGRFVLFYSALLHDIAKSSSTREEPDGRIVSPGHSRRGSIDARGLLWRAGAPFDLRERICRIISVHQLPFFALAGDRSGRTPEFILRKLSCELSLRELCAVAEADMRGRDYEGKAGVLEDIELLRELARELNCFDGPYAFPDDHTRLTYVRMDGRIAPDYPFHQEPGSKAFVLSGMPAAGKNTWVSANCPDLPVLSFDDAREELGLKHGVDAGAAAQLVIERAKELLRRKEPFVWNATHLSGQMRAKTLDLLYAYGAEVEIVYLESPEHEIKARNARRDTTLTNGGIDRMLQRWETPLPTEAHRVRYLVEN